MFDKRFSFPNWLASAHMSVDTYTATESDGCVVTEPDGRKVIPSGAVFPSNDANAVGIAFERVDVTDENKPIAVLVHGFVYEERLPELPSNNAKGALDLIQFEDYNRTEVRVDSIAITTAPTKTAYGAGDDFDPTGMKVTLTYTDGGTQVVEADEFADNYLSYPSAKITGGQTKVVITYKHGKTTKTADQAITVS